MIDPACDAAQQIVALHEAWLRAEREGRPEGVLALCTGDVTFQPPDSPPAEGRAAVAALLGTAPLDLLEAFDLRIEVADRLAVKRARFRVRASPGGPVVEGRHLWVLRPRWRVALATWSFDAP